MDATDSSDAGSTTGTDGSANDGSTQTLTQLDVTTAPTLTTELGTTNTLDITLDASNGFVGDVSLAATVLDGSQAPLTGWSYTIDTPNVVLAQNGTTTVHLTLTIPSENNGLAATATVTATGAAATGTWSASTVIAVQNQYTIELPVENGACVYPPPGIINISVGTKVRWLNVSTSAENFNIHSDGGPSGCPHEDVSLLTPPGEAYECVISVVDTPFTWYCHSPGPLVSDRLIAPVL